MIVKRVTRADNLDLMELVGAVEAGAVVLPNFQRDFDWSVSQIRSLVATVLQGWPLGSLLLIEGEADRDFYAPRSFEGVEGVASSIQYIVMDGQQRLTALLRALKGVGPLVYAVRIPKASTLSSIDQVDRAVVAIKREAWPPTPTLQYQSGLLPVSALGEASDFYAWRDAATAGGDKQGIDQLTDLYRESLSGIHKYQVPVVLIGTNVGPEAVARIFERVNRTGTKLGTFDLMVAKSYTSEFNLRQAWEDLRLKNERVRSFLDDDGLPILTTIALRLANDVRQSAVLELPGSALADAWDSAAGHFERAIDFVVDRLGVIDSDFLPYRMFLPVLAALDHDFDINDRAAILEDWYWSTAISGRYDEGSNTSAVSDFQSLRRGANPFEETELVVVLDNAVESTKGQHGTFHRTFLNGLALALTHSNLIDEAIDGRIRVGTFFSRDREGGALPPLHLRTLGMRLGRAEGRRIEYFDPMFQFGDPTNAVTPESGMGERYRAFVRFIESRTGRRVKVSKATEDNEIEAIYGSSEEDEA